MNKDNLVAISGQNILLPFKVFFPCECHCSPQRHNWAENYWKLRVKTNYIMPICTMPQSSKVRLRQHLSGMSWTNSGSGMSLMITTTNKQTSHDTWISWNRRLLKRSLFKTSTSWEMAINWFFSFASSRTPVVQSWDKFIRYYQAVLM